MRKKRIILYSSLFVVLISLSLIYFCNKIINQSAKGKLYTSANDIPKGRVGLLLGTSKFSRGGKGFNPYYNYRIEATLNLYKANKIKYVIVSGDNSRNDYNEPGLMREDLIKGGVDSTHIFLDYAGFRTFDSMVRLKEVFGEDSVTIISQKFHNQRALYIASQLGISAIGFNASDVSSKMGFRTQLREKFARVKVFLDNMVGKKPKFLGPKITLPL